METNVSVWKANLVNGLIIGLIGVMFSLVTYFFDLTFNKWIAWVWIVLQLVIMFFLVKSYRDNYRHGFITFGQALGAGMVICLYQAVIAAIFTYLLYKFIDANLVDKQLAYIEGMMQERGLPEEAIELSMNMQKKLMIPEVMAPFSIIASMFYGLFMSLIIAAFVRREGNPLIDATAAEPQK
jgi:FlaA1/EpsC-like NDP-sugar epimerase